MKNPRMVIKSDDTPPITNELINSFFVANKAVEN
jgi:hypothetical protein